MSLKKFFLIKISLIFILSGIFIFLNGLFNFSYGGELSGSISVTPASVKRGKSVEVRIDAQHPDGISEIILEIRRNNEIISKTSKDVGGEISVVRSWEERVYSAGSYDFCGYAVKVGSSSPLLIDCTVVDVCEDQCFYVGQKECYDNVHKRICGDYYKEDECLEWSSLEKCQGDTSCGYGDCPKNQKPKWVCRKGECTYICVDSPECGPVCQDECSSGETRCFDSLGIQECGNYDKDKCLEWPDSYKLCQGDTSCGYGECLENQKPKWVCRKGECTYICVVDPKCGSVCQNECSVGETRCFDNLGIQECGNYDDDNCLEWPDSYNLCRGDTYCGYGSCNSNQRASWSCVAVVVADKTVASCRYSCFSDPGCGLKCQDECPVEGESQCVGNLYKKTCSPFNDSDSCLEWSDAQSCVGDSSCGYGKCSDNQRPRWSCQEGKCGYQCFDDLTCQPGAPSLPLIKEDRRGKPLEEVKVGKIKEVEEPKVSMEAPMGKWILEQLISYWFIWLPLGLLIISLLSILMVFLFRKKNEPRFK